MDKLLIRGGRQLHGEVRISGAKNAALPELCAALLTDQPVVLQNVPRLQDVATMLTLIRNMGVTIERDENATVRIDSTSPGATPSSRSGCRTQTRFTRSRSSRAAWHSA